MRTPNGQEVVGQARIAQLIPLFPNEGVVLLPINRAVGYHRRNQHFRPLQQLTRWELHSQIGQVALKLRVVVSLASVAN
jgi:hypothetical protein